MRSYSAPFETKVQAANKRLKSTDNKAINLLEVVSVSSPVTVGHWHFVSPSPAWIIFLELTRGEKIPYRQLQVVSMIAAELIPKREIRALLSLLVEDYCAVTGSEQETHRIVEILSGEI
jgi:hypothetical protein